MKIIQTSHPNEIKNKINGITKNKWEEMANNCIEWYGRNCSIDGSFKTTMEILEKNKINEIFVIW